MQKLHGKVVDKRQTGATLNLVPHPVEQGGLALLGGSVRHSDMFWIGLSIIKKGLSITLSIVN